MSTSQLCVVSTGQLQGPGNSLCISQSTGHGHHEQILLKCALVLGICIYLQIFSEQEEFVHTHGTKQNKTELERERKKDNMRKTGKKRKTVANVAVQQSSVLMKVNEAGWQLAFGCEKKALLTSSCIILQRLVLYILPKSSYATQVASIKPGKNFTFCQLAI